MNVLWVSDHFVAAWRQSYPEMDADAITERLARTLFVADVYWREE